MQADEFLQSTAFVAISEFLKQSFPADQQHLISSAHLNTFFNSLKQHKSTLELE